METNKRGWIKNLIIIFLVLILIFTLFSNTFMNRSLPEVAVSNSESGTITTQVKLTGTVNANSVKQITLDYARKINEVLVRRGDTVTPGMVIATLVRAPRSTTSRSSSSSCKLNIKRCWWRPRIR